MFKKEDIEHIDLSSLATTITNLESRGYFMLGSGMEHYKLLAYISTLYNDSLLYDIGTYRGCSAIALSYNINNKVKSFDIGDFRAIKDSPDNIEWCVGDFLAESVEEILSSPFIMLDIDHTGIMEQKILDFLLEHKWKGMLLLDDIYLNTAMKNFWDNIQQEKYDLTYIGHFSGTGLVVL